MLLSVDWDFFSGCVEHIFDAPIWGSRDTPFDRLEAWQVRADKRGGVLGADFPLLENWRWLWQWQGVPAYATLSHADAFGLLERIGCSSVVNLDSHHDLFSSSGDTARVRPGNWAGLALERGLIDSYCCVYPSWHEHVMVAEGFDLERTWSELGGRFAAKNVQLERTPLAQLELTEVTAILLVQSPAWTNPEHDAVFLEVCQFLQTEFLELPLNRSHFHTGFQEVG